MIRPYYNGDFAPIDLDSLDKMDWLHSKERLKSFASFHRVVVAFFQELEPLLYVGLQPPATPWFSAIYGEVYPHSWGLTSHVSHKFACIRVGQRIE